MLIAASLVPLVFASALAAGVVPVTPLPPIAISVSTSSTLSPTLVTRVLDETAAVWRPAGLTFVWRREPVDARQSVDANPPCLAPALRVVIGSGRAADVSRRHDNVMALGWIVFGDDDKPDQEIYLSFDNAQAYMVSARAVVGLIDRMPTAEREMLLARVMGRALAHEIGHYLLASKVHTPRGLMQATHTATDFFSMERRAFAVDVAQRQAVFDRLRQDRTVAVRHDMR
jgi:hypothetical protein